MHLAKILGIAHIAIRKIGNGNASVFAVEQQHQFGYLARAECAYGNDAFCRTQPFAFVRNTRQIFNYPFELLAVHGLFRCRSTTPVAADFLFRFKRFCCLHPELIVAIDIACC